MTDNPVFQRPEKPPVVRPPSIYGCLLHSPGDQFYILHGDQYKEVHAVVRDLKTAGWTQASTIKYYSQILDASQYKQLSVPKVIELLQTVI